jgi:hypothetical protein
VVPVTRPVEAAVSQNLGKTAVVSFPSRQEIAAATERVRALCLALPETSERLSHGAPTFFVRGKKAFVMVLVDHHRDGIFGLWTAAPPGNQELLVAADPERFFRPPYVGHRGWLGVRLDRTVDWDEVAGIVEDAWATVAPKSLLASLGEDA